MATTLTEQRDGCDLCKWAPLPPSELAWVANDLGADEVRHYFALDWLADEFAATYADRTYQAVRVDRKLQHLTTSPDWLLESLRKAPRRERNINECIVFETY